MCATLNTLPDRPKILVVDDDAEIVTLLRLALERAGAHALAAYSGPQALRITFDQRPDVVLLDINMPGMDGYTVCERLRDMSDMPIIMLTALNATQSVTHAFELGADDYVVKPFEMAELMARVQACLRRMPQATQVEDNLALGQGDLIIDLRRHRVWVRQTETHLTKTEFELLVYLARNRGRVLSHPMIHSAIWGENSEIGLDTLKQFIGALRRKIEADPHQPKWLLSERGIGYSLSLD